MAWRVAFGRLAVGGAAAATLGLGGVTYCETSGPIFDPEALERGAKALREINKSTNAKQVGFSFTPRNSFNLEVSSRVGCSKLSCLLFVDTFFV
jgi:hypothetical protein